MGCGPSVEQAARSEPSTYHFKNGSTTTATTPPRSPRRSRSPKVRVSPDVAPPSLLSPDTTCCSSTVTSSTCDKESPLRKTIPCLFDSVDADDYLDDPLPPPNENHENSSASETADETETTMETINETTVLVESAPDSKNENEQEVTLNNSILQDDEDEDETAEDDEDESTSDQDLTEKHAVLVQSHIRAHLAVQHYQQQQKAALLCQTQWRGKTVRTHQHDRLQGAVVVQSAWRQAVQRRRWSTYRAAVVAVQQWTRATLERRERERQAARLAELEQLQLNFVQTQATLESEIASLQSRLHEADHHDTLKVTELSERVAELEEYKQKTAEATMEIAGFKCRLQEAEERENELLSKIADLQGQLTFAEDCKHKLLLAENTITDLKQKLKDAEEYQAEKEQLVQEIPKKDAQAEAYKLKLLMAEQNVTELRMKLDEANARTSKEDELQARLEKMSENLAHMEAYQMKAVQLEIQVAQLQNDLVAAGTRETKEAELEAQCKTLKDKLDEAESLLSVADTEAKEQARKAVEAYREVEVARALHDNENNDKSTNQDQSAHLSAKQQSLMSESGRMLEMLRNQVVKLRSQNKHMKSDLEALKMANQRLVDANGEAGLSFASLSEKTKTISQNNDTLAVKLKESRAQIKALKVAQAELKEELQMKKATYGAEVRSRLVLEKGMARIVDIAQEDCRDTRVVEAILKVADECDLESAFA